MAMTKMDGEQIVARTQRRRPRIFFPGNFVWNGYLDIRNIVQ